MEAWTKDLLHLFLQLSFVILGRKTSKKPCHQLQRICQIPQAGVRIRSQCSTKGYRFVVLNILSLHLVSFEHKVFSLLQAHADFVSHRGKDEVVPAVHSRSPGFALFPSSGLELSAESSNTRGSEAEL